jgi:hypothetical protein
LEPAHLAPALFTIREDSSAIERDITDQPGRTSHQQPAPFQ